MKLITLNMWGGRVAQPLTDFLQKHEDVDVFMFQEIFESNGDFERPEEKDRARVQEVLTNHVGYYRPATADGFGLATFVKKGLVVERESEVFVHGDKDAILGDEPWEDIGKNLQSVTIVSESGEKYTVFNLHGLWEEVGKTDTPARLRQSENVIAFIKQFNGKVILAGDFNLRPDTESIKMIEQELGLKNLVTEYSITSTRTALYTRSDEKFADYIFVSPDVEVKSFAVMPDEVSDHAALYLEI